MYHGFGHFISDIIEIDTRVLCFFGIDGFRFGCCLLAIIAVRRRKRAALRFVNAKNLETANFVELSSIVSFSQDQFYFAANTSRAWLLQLLPSLDS